MEPWKRALGHQVPPKSHLPVRDSQGCARDRPRAFKSIPWEDQGAKRQQHGPKMETKWKHGKSTVGFASRNADIEFDQPCIYYILSMLALPEVLQNVHPK